MDVNLNIGQEAQTADLTGATTTPGTFVGGLLSGVMSIAALLVLLYFVWGAIEWITAGGDQSKIQKGRDRIVQSGIGIIVLASSVAIFIVLQTFLGINVITFWGNGGNSAGQGVLDGAAGSRDFTGGTGGASGSLEEAADDDSWLDRLRGINNSNTNDSNELNNNLNSGNLENSSGRIPN